MNNYANLPVELTALNQWVCTGGNSKIPMTAFGFDAASSTNPATWASFEEAREAVDTGMYNYLGFVFADNGIVGIDIDCGYDELGLMSPLAADIISRCKSYTERSKSGRGFHILLKGDLPFKGKNNLAGVEIYKTARYFIMTGDTVIFTQIAENQEAIDYVVEKYFPEVEKESEKPDRLDRIYTPEWKDISPGKIPIRPVYPEIKAGNRHISLVSLAGQLHTQGYRKKAILDELLKVNETVCKPPLPRKEIEQITSSIVRYKR